LKGGALVLGKVDRFAITEKMANILGNLTRETDVYFPKRDGIYGEADCIKVNKIILSVPINYSTIDQIFSTVYGDDYSSNEITKMMVKRYYGNTRMVNFVEYRNVIDQQIVEIFFEDLLGYGGATDTRFPEWMSLNDFLKRITIVPKDTKR
jgi:hypothetical protein